MVMIINIAVGELLKFVWLFEIGVEIGGCWWGYNSNDESFIVYRLSFIVYGGVFQYFE